MPLVSITCPYCSTANTSFVVKNFKAVSTRSTSQKPRDTNYESVANCSGCGSYVALFFEVSGGGRGEYRLPDSAGKINNATFPGNTKVKLIGYLPAPPKPEVPEHLPENVERSFLGAEKARMAGLWTEAANSYGKAIDRGITPLLPKDDKRRTLGQKLGWLRDHGELPAALIDWIGVVLKDRNFATHDDDRDFENAGEVAPIRNFASILLTYLFTMPRRVEIARERE